MCLLVDCVARCVCSWVCVVAEQNPLDVRVAMVRVIHNRNFIFIIVLLVVYLLFLLVCCGALLLLLPCAISEGHMSGALLRAGHRALPLDLLWLPHRLTLADLAMQHGSLATQHFVHFPYLQQKEVRVWSVLHPVRQARPLHIDADGIP